MDQRSRRVELAASYETLCMHSTDDSSMILVAVFLELNDPLAARSWKRVALHLTSKFPILSLPKPLCHENRFTYAVA